MFKSRRFMIIVTLALLLVSGHGEFAATAAASAVSKAALVGDSLPPGSAGGEQVKYDCNQRPLEALDSGQLNAAIACYNSAQAGNVIISMAADILLTGATTPISNTTGIRLTIAGNGRTVNGDGTYRGLTIVAGEVTIDRLTVANGSSPFGGGIQNSGTLRLNNSTLANNNATQSGGGIYNLGGVLLIDNSTLTDNTAAGVTGGGVLNSGAMLVRNSTIKSNSAPFGGGVYNNNNTLTLINSTVSGNAGTTAGGGIYNDGNAVTILNSTVAGNTSAAGGGIYNFGGSLDFRNSIVADSPAGGDCASSGGIASGTYTLIEDGSCIPIGSSNNISGDPLLAALSADTGATATHALLPGSPAIDAADNGRCSSAPVGNQDQRRNLRHDGQCDMGAYEADSAGRCAATHDNGATVQFSLDAGAVQSATALAGAGATVKVAGACVGVQPQAVGGGTITQTVYISNSLTLEGGHTPANWAGLADGSTYPTVLDAFRQGRGVVLHDAAATGTMTVTLKHLTIRNGLTATDGFAPFYGHGGGVFVGAGVTFTLDHSTLSNNIASGDSFIIVGGGLFNEGTATISNSTISGNLASNGGGIYNVAGTATVGSSTLSDNLANFGGGIFNSGTAMVSSSTLSGNWAGNNGGGIYNDSTAMVSNSTLSHNVAAYGGGIYNVGAATVDISNSTLLDNSATYGGGIYNEGTATANIGNSTLSGNSAGTSGGGIYNEGTATVGNSIIANSVSGGDCGFNNSAPAFNHSLVEDGSCAIAMGTGNLIGDPALGPLADNGGATMTHALLPFSPAVNAGDNATCLATDQRGVARPQGATCDIGSFEAEPPFCMNPAGVNDTNELNAAITCFNSATLAGTYVISFTDNISLTNEAATINNGIAGIDLQINGNGFTLDGQGSVRGFGIAIYTNVAIDRLTIQNGRTTVGGGIVNVGTLTVSNSTLSGNSTPVGDTGGGIYNVGSLTVSNTLLSGNSSGSGGGIFNGGSMTVSNSLLSGNSADFGAGGGITNGTTGTAAISNSVISDNSTGPVDPGGGIYNAGSLTVSNSLLSGNSAEGGGGIYNEGTGTVDISNSTLSDNVSALSSGGGIANEGSLTVSNSLLSGNEALYDGGGGIANGTGGTVDISNSTLSGNTADVFGGGIFNNGTATVSSSTLSGNSAYDGGGIYNQGTVHLSNSILANSISGDCLNVGANAASTFSHSLVEDGGCDLVTGAGNLTGDPHLGPLADNGGSTLTHALLPGSPALDAIPTAACPATTDQRGLPRPQNAACEMGAYEQWHLAIALTSGGLLSWADAPGCTYDVFVSSTPYFTPQEPPTYAAISASPQSITTEVGDTATNHSFINRIVCPDLTTYSQEVGEFSFPITPGD